MFTFEQSRVCSSCEEEELRPLSKIEAAFVQTSDWDSPCGSCGGRTFSSIARPMPRLDPEILERWASDNKVDLIEQDEDLIMAATENLELLQAFVVRDDALMTKRAIMLSALCLLVYDSVDREDAQTYDDTVKFLQNNRHLFAEIGDEYIFDYIKIAVYPAIGLEPPAQSSS